MSIKAPDIVVDTNQTRYPLDRLLGRGGQGAVYAVRDRALAVKLADARHAAEQRRVRENIARIRRLPLDGLNVARPLRALAEPHVGYVMELMTGMMPLQALAHVPREHAADFVPWYVASGSLHRRLALLAHTADLFRELHARGLAYGDASPSNIFVSEAPDASEVWLIDCDNIFAGVSPRAVYTPGYAAPELFRGHAGADSLTDAWSLATLVFETLCMLHPFEGDLVHDGPPELEEQAFRGELPWVDDTDDSRNATARGIPRDLVLTRPLRQLSSECFGASRLDRLSRPTVAAWAEKLHQAADQVLVCPACRSGYYVNQAVCPWCEAPRPPFVLANVHLRDPALADDTRTPLGLVCKQRGQPLVVARVAIQADHLRWLTTRHLCNAEQDSPQVSARLEGNALVLRGEDMTSFMLVNRHLGQEQLLAGRNQRISFRDRTTPWLLVPQEARDLHRVVVFELNPGAAA
jgi:eukaryotic-like serine/threonine-protein kinase